MIPALDWAGRIFGTNTGNLFLKVDELPDKTLRGVLRIADDRLGLTVYDIEGTFDGSEFIFVGKPQELLPDINAGEIAAKGFLNKKGEVEGDWSSTLGTAGRFFLVPHGRPEGDDNEPDQLHIARFDFGPIEIIRSEIEEIADLVQADFGNPVVVTITAETEQTVFLKRFKELSFSEEFANIIKIRAQSPERGGIARVVQVEFGPQFNYVLAQSTDEAWARGKRDMLRHKLKLYERSYATLWKRLGFGINQLLFLALLVFLPGLPSNMERAVLVVGFVGISQALTQIDSRILRHASIKLRKRKPSWLDQLGPTFLSWTAGVLGTVLAGLLLALLQGWLELPNLALGSPVLP
ncbi:MAG: hypothetical protein AAFY43_05975 [Pseudomonadota bacterium]